VEQGPAFHEQLYRLGAEDREDRLVDGGCLLGSERPGADGWEFDAEQGVGVLDRLGDATWDVLVVTAWQVSQSRPLTALRKPATARSWSPAP
jgi:hypothetical protein